MDNICSRNYCCISGWKEVQMLQLQILWCVSHECGSSFQLAGICCLYCCVARWYKRRERDEPCNERARIEEIYGRYVEHNRKEEQDAD